MAVRNDFAAGEVLAAADLNDTFASKLDLAGGKILQVVSTLKNDTFSASVASDVTGLTATITPSAATSKVLVIVHLSLGWSLANNGAPLANLRRGSTDIALSTGASTANSTITPREFVGNNTIELAAITFLDSPATTSATTYGIRIGIAGGGTFYVNRSGASADVGSTSSITVMEVSA